MQRSIEYRMEQKHVMFRTVVISKTKVKIYEVQTRLLTIKMSVRQRLSISGQAWRQRWGAPRIVNMYSHVVLLLSPVRPHDIRRALGSNELRRELRLRGIYRPLYKLHSKRVVADSSLPTSSVPKEQGCPSLVIRAIGTRQPHPSLAQSNFQETW